MIDHSSRSPWGPVPSRSRLGAQNLIPSPQLKQVCPTTFVFIKFLPSHTIEAEEPPWITFWDPVTWGSGYRVKTQLRTFLLSKKIPVPNFTKISLAVWISIEDTQTNKQTFYIIFRLFWNGADSIMYSLNCLFVIFILVHCQGSGANIQSFSIFLKTLFCWATEGLLGWNNFFCLKLFQ